MKRFEDMMAGFLYAVSQPIFLHHKRFCCFTIRTRRHHIYMVCLNHTIVEFVQVSIERKQAFCPLLKIQRPNRDTTLQQYIDEPGNTILNCRCSLKHYCQGSFL